MHLPQIVAETLGWLSYQFIQIQPLLPTYTHLVLSAVFPIYAGAYSSLSRPTSAAKPEKKKSVKGGQYEAEEEEEEERQMEGLSPTDAIMFPVLAGCTLAGLYYLIKWMQDPTMLNKILNWYFAFFSVFSVSRLVSDGLDVAHSLIFPQHYIDQGKLFQIDAPSKRAVTTHEKTTEYRDSPLPAFLSRMPLPRKLLDGLFWCHVLPYQKLTFSALIHRVLSVKMRLGMHGISGLTVGLATVLYYNFVGKPWFLTNMMGFGFAYGALQLMSPTTFWTGTLVLSALFFYDIYFVFFTPMMVTVAKSLDVPIKLLFPRPAEPDAEPGIQALSMLGLGDVVLPGMMIGLALRFDLFMFYLRKQTIFSSPATEDAPGLELKKNVLSEDKVSSENTGGVPQTEKTKNQTKQVIKAPYKSVAGGWGDGLWTSSFFGKTPRSFTCRGAFPKPYFHASLIGYVVGMLTTLGAMQVSEHPQPALLYLVPGVVSSLWLKGWIRGEIREMWEFSEASDEEDEESSKKDEKSKAKEKADSEASRKDDKGVKEEGKSKSNSIFSYARAEERSRRLEKVVSKSVTQFDNDKSGCDSEYDEYEEEDKLVEHEDAKRGRGPLMLSFSIRAPPSPFLDVNSSSNKSAAYVEKGTLQHEKEKERDDESPRARSSATKLAKEGSFGDRDRQHVDKRLRIS